MNLKSTAKNVIKQSVGGYYRAKDRRREWPDPTERGFEYAEGWLQLAGHNLHQLASEHEGPIHVLDVDKLERNISDITSANYAGHRCELYFSYKTQPVPGALDIMHAAGVGAEIISEFELWLAERQGVDPSKIIYNGPGKSTRSLVRAVDIGIGCINANSLAELELIQGLAKTAGKVVNVGVRAQADSGWSAQFGLDADGNEFRQCWELIQASPQLLPTMLHVHRGIALRDVPTMQAHVRRVLAIADKVEALIGQTLPAVDFGGSLATPTVRWFTDKDRQMARRYAVPAPPPVITSDTLTPERYANVVLETTVSVRKKQSKSVPRLILEPGRGLTGNAFHLLLQVMHTKPAAVADYLIMNGGINVGEILRNEWHHVIPCHQAPNAAVQRLVGPLCTPGDTVNMAVHLPRLQAGDCVCIADSGAYFVPFSSAFSFPRAGIIGLRKGHPPKILRRNEAFQDLVSLDS